MKAPTLKPGVRFPLVVKAVVIDLDGTLLHTAPDLAAAAQRMAEELKLPPIDEATVKTYIGNGVSRLVKRVLTRDMQAEPEAALFTSPSGTPWKGWLWWLTTWRA